MLIDCKAPRKKVGEPSVSFADRCQKVSFTAENEEQQERLGKLARIVCGSQSKRVEFWLKVLEIADTVLPDVDARS